jgi:hypothetical protein
VKTSREIKKKNQIKKEEKSWTSSSSFFNELLPDVNNVPHPTEYKQRKEEQDDQEAGRSSSKLATNELTKSTSFLCITLRDPFYSLLGAFILSLSLCVYKSPVARSRGY